jgi:hypothetical protein
MPAIEKKKRILIPLGIPRKPSTSARFLLAVLPLFRPIFFVLGWIYKLCFGWLDQSAARQNHERFAQDIHTHLYFLFSEHGAQVLPPAEKDLPQSLDFAIVKVAAEGILFRFVRGRGDFGVEVASQAAPNNFEDLGLVMLAMQPPQDAKEHQAPYYRLATLGAILKPQFGRLEDALSKQSFEATLNAAVRMHNDRTDNYVAELHQKGIRPKFW